MHRGKPEDERHALNGIAATLLALAVVADFLCVLPFRLRVSVLSLLRPAEAIARRFALESAGGPLALPPVAVCGPDGDGSAEAMRLARCFRALAVIIGSLQASAGWRPFRGSTCRRPAQGAPATAWLSRAMKARRAMALLAARCIDTS